MSATTKSKLSTELDDQYSYIQEALAKVFDNYKKLKSRG